ncbi:Zn(II)2Cys6 transcription factor domain-containing protein [Aspergillus mulundensis]|uniref:Putative Zn(II)2Cys6 transcription factor n=1 Tax=Aspergillus mulundensis TaxID=1810919 RepID=A0A3D8T2E7_9EURO|nr:putative Zn(II)2Cys6 transcription factor [Aspergillus mulundensis]RDW92723.1 putative Zn(II)2Cys6 transcription factor [Aspergillus mulundensis]
MADAENIRATPTPAAGTMRKATRKSMPKVRTGCATCKQRRIKCDEGKPSCRNCERTGRRCEGYPTPVPAAAVSGEADDTRVRAQTRPQQITVYNLPFKIPGSQADRQLLHFYICEAAGGLSSFSDPTLWTNLILQRSHHQPVIRHALITLASLYRDYLQGGNKIQMSASSAAMERIGKCHRQLRLYLRSPDASADIALICSILFFAFETLMGDSITATKHLDNGLYLLKRCQAQMAANASDDLLPQLTSLFSRLDIHASTFDDERMPILNLVTSDETAGFAHIVPSQLTTIDEAEVVLTKLENWLMHHIIAHVAHKHKPADELPRDLLRERFVLYQQFERFFFAYSALLQSLVKPDNIPPRALLLRIQARMYYSVLLENIPNDTFGPCPPADSLRNTLRDLETFLSMGSTEQSSKTFTLSSQLVAILYFMCLKTPDRERREYAFGLLRHSSMPAKDGLWESEKAASIVQILIDQTKEREGSLEQTGKDVFRPEDGGIENVFREISNRPRPGCLAKRLLESEGVPDEPHSPVNDGTF